MKFLYFTIVGFLLTLMSCQETENIVPKPSSIRSDRVVLVEDFTGVKCPNCPNASKDINNLISIYPENIVAVAYQTNFLGDPINNQNHHSKYDFRTQDGQILEEKMGGYLGKPALTLNRKKYDESVIELLTLSTVLGNTSSELNSIPEAIIHIENHYDEGSRLLNSIVTIEPKVNATGSFRLHSLITESGIIDVQIDGTTYVEDYVHNHVFRSMLSSIDGDEIGSNLTVGSNIVKEYNFTLPPEQGWWVADNCSVVAFISDLSKKTYEVGEIVQAAEAHLIE